MCMCSSVSLELCVLFLCSVPFLVVARCVLYLHSFISVSGLASIAGSLGISPYIPW